MAALMLLEVETDVSPGDLLLSDQMSLPWRRPLKHGPDTIAVLRNSKWRLALECLHGGGGGGVKGGL